MVGAMACQLDLPSLHQLPVAGCGRLQLGATPWAILVVLLQVVYNCPHKLWEDYIFYISDHLFLFLTYLLHRLGWKVTVIFDKYIEPCCSISIYCQMVSTLYCLSLRLSFEPQNIWAVLWATKYLRLLNSQVHWFVPGAMQSVWRCDRSAAEGADVSWHQEKRRLQQQEVDQS